MPRSEALKRAQQKYEATTNRPLSIRFFFDEIEDIDALRGDMTRNAWIRKVVLEAIKTGKEKAGG